MTSRTGSAAARGLPDPRRRRPIWHDSDAVHESPDPLDAHADAPVDTDDAGARPVDRLFARLGALDGTGAAALGVEVVVLAGAVLFVLAALGPGLLTADTTPAGGDMGAHVWGPAYLRDHLLSDGRLAGWAPDWYAGFPAYHFYMVVPALLIVALDAGWGGWAAVVPAAAALGLAAVAVLHRRQRARRIAAVAAVTVALLGIGLPYGIAFKWVTVAGLLAFPIACYVAARLADLPFPGPTLVALGSVVFLFNREPTTNGTGNIIGGNMTSTLAGEFSFSLSLVCCVLYVGFLLRGLRTGGYRATCAVLLGLTALCHVIPAIYAVGITVVALLVSLPWDRRKLRWFLPIGPVALAISAFWTLPFAARRAYLNDMGWEKIPSGISEVPLRDFLVRVWTADRYDEFRTALLDVVAPSSLRWVITLAFVGAVVSAILRIRLGVLLTVCAMGSLVAFVLAPQGRLWNARILPFYVLCICLLAGIAVGELARAIASLATRAGRPLTDKSPVSIATPVVAGVAVWIAVGLPLGVLPGGTRTAEGAERWMGLEVSSASRSPVRDWARWNYTGYERKDAYPEYHDLIELGQRLAADPTLGCGRVMWEYENERLNRYGTPMAPMLLPFWTDGCIGSMEGLYFEASATTPYHFLNQRALSDRCSCAQRDLPYGGGFDIDLGVAQLQQMGVRYYFAFTDTAVAAASAHPDLTEVGASDDGVWHAYLVADSDLVVALDHQPAVVTGVEPGMSWVGVASKWWQDPSRWDVVLADEDGPAAWERVEACTAPRAPKPSESAVDEPTWTRIDVCHQPGLVDLPPVEVTNVVVGRDSISFDVSEPGVPVLVKMSYFPNWQASGADGPYRVSPNHMVVVPTGTSVELSYGWTGVDLGAYGLSALGIAGAVALARRPGRRDDADADVWLDGPDPIGRTGDAGIGDAGTGDAADGGAWAWGDDVWGEDPRPVHGPPEPPP
jgi:hypothetical protein